ncbi:transposase [Sporolactobacillus sp. KGMB 08714]
MKEDPNLDRSSSIPESISLSLVFLPPYSPDFNLIEELWNRTR